MEIEWVRGDVLGHGSFASVNLAKPRNNSDDDDRFPSSMAVKSCEDCCSSTLKNEKEVLDQIGYCQQIIRCFGDGCSVEKDHEEEEEEEETKTISLKVSSSVSPRSPFSFPYWVSIHSSAENSRFEFDDSFLSSRNISSCLLDRIRNLAGDWRPEWSDQDVWVTVRR
ncbi:hypothetical protein QYF36_017988 [Acer negundo]|nr:hypothetical protein QYF36_017988 [Acer negundo]